MQAYERRALRQRAERELVASREPERESGVFETSSAQLLRELQLHHIELEMQNDALRDALDDADRSRNRYRKIFELAPVAYLCLSRDTTVLRLNGAGGAMLSTESGQVLGTRLSRLVHPDHVERFELYRRAVLRGDRQRPCELALRTGERAIDVSLHSERNDDESGDWWVVLIDHSDRRRFERGEEERAFVSSVLDSVGLVALIDRSGRITHLNSACTTLLAHQASNVGRDFADVFVVPHEREYARSMLTRVGQHGKTAWESSFHDHTGAPVRLSWSATPLVDDSGADLIIAHATDVTDRHLLQEQLVVADRLAAVGTLSATVAHEINNPLAYVRASLELIGRELAAGVEPAHVQPVLERLHTALEGCDRIRGVVDDLRGFCGHAQNHERPSDVRAILDDALRIAQNELRHRAQVVREYGEVPLVRASGRRLGQVFLNLVLNAAHAIPAGDMLRNRVVVRTYASGDRVQVEISDTGSGIAPEVCAQLFNPFFSTKPSGMGLGLSICRSIVTEAGGQISVESTLGAGSTFRVTLPAEAQTAYPPPASLAAPLRELPPQSSARLSVLVVDDEPAVARSIAALLCDHDVHIASGGRVGLAMCAQQAYDVILCDVLMPEMTGIELHARLHELGRGDETRMVFVTGGAFTEDAQQFLGDVSNAVLGKPFTADELVRIVHSAAQRRITAQVHETS